MAEDTHVSATDLTATAGGLEETHGFHHGWQLSCAEYVSNKFHCRFALCVVPGCKAEERSSHETLGHALPPASHHRLRSRRLTQNLVQLHNGRVRADAMDGLGLLGDLALLDDVLIVADCLVGRHCEVGWGAVGGQLHREDEEEEGKGEKSDTR